MSFRDRHDAGRALAARLSQFAARPDVLVLGLPRGGVPVAAEVAAALGAPLDAFLVRKLGLPGHEELAIGAIATGGVRVLNLAVLDEVDLPPAEIDAIAERELRELERRERAYRDDRPAPDLRGRTVILVDDGLATGSTMRAAIQAARAQGAARIVVAAPVGAIPTCHMLEDEADQVVCVLTPANFAAVGLWYDDFTPTTDDEVRALLAGARPAAGEHVP